MGTVSGQPLTQAAPPTAATIVACWALLAAEAALLAEVNIGMAERQVRRLPTPRRAPSMVLACRTAVPPALTWGPELQCAACCH